MIRVFLLIWAAIWVIMHSPVNVIAEENGSWKAINSGIYGQHISAIVAAKTGKLFAATENALYVSEDGADGWQRIVYLPKSTMKINDIAVISGDYLKICLATTDGLYQIIIDGGKMNRIFAGWGNKRYVNCVKIKNAEPNKLYAGTRAGMYISNDHGRHWKDLKYFKNMDIKDMVFLDNDIFVVADNGIYFGNEISDNWKRIFVINTSKTGEEEIEEESYDEEAMPQYGINCIAADIAAKNIYAGTDNGIVISSDMGKTWQRFSSNGLMNRHIEDIIIINNIQQRCIFAATEKGLHKFFYKKENDKTPNNENNYADYIKRQMEKDPGILEVQNAAVKYAEVSPEKIKWMRNAAKNKAWLPTLNLDFDYDADNNVDMDRRGTNDPDIFIIGPNDESYSWGVSLGWDLGDLVWNDDQTNIDVRSRLMVQLRDDILTEITGLYFERRKLQIDIISNKYSEAIRDAKLLQLQEIAARIDALTGGYLSMYGGLYEEIPKTQP